MNQNDYFSREIIAAIINELERSLHPDMPQDTGYKIVRRCIDVLSGLNK